MVKKIKTAVIGASGYTGADFIRLAVNHPSIELTALVAHSHAGKSVKEVFPHLAMVDLPDLISIDQIDWEKVQCVVSGLPHGASQDLLKQVPKAIKIIDMSADFRLNDPKTYEQWYGRSHDAPVLLKQAVYGLPEIYERDLKKANLAACPGCYPTASLLALYPLVKEGGIDASHIIIDAKSGVSGAGRSLKQNTLFCEAGEGLSPYGIAAHRHSPEIEQELTLANGGKGVSVTFTPHLVPMSRGELVTCYVNLAKGKSAKDLKEILNSFYKDKPFIRVVKDKAIPSTQQVRGSNYCLINCYDDRIKGKAIIVAAIDNLVKGSAGQAMQNFNLMHGLDVTQGLKQLALFP